MAPRNDRGTVMIEFVIALMPVLLFFLGLIQYGLTTAAHLVVQHAAVTGARAAVVAFEDDDAAYAGEDRGLLWDGEQLSLRAETVRGAVYFPLAAVAPTLSQMWPREDSVRRGIGDVATRLLAHEGNRASFIAVTFPREPGAEGEDFHRVDPYGPSDEITVRVTVLFRCLIPLVSAIMCDRGYELLTGVPIDDIAGAASNLSDPELFDAALAGDFERVRELSGADDVQAGRERLEKAEQHMLELSYVEMRSGQIVGLLNGQRFVVLRAEATLPNQGAAYYPREADDG